MTGSQGSVTVIVPSRGRHHLATMVIARLTELGCQVILVDDGSEPPLALPSHRLLHVLRQDPTGAGAARNRGAAVSSTDWICFSDSDVFWNEVTLSRLRELVATTPPRVWTIGEIHMPPSERTITANWMRALQDESRPPAGSDECWMATGLLLCRRVEFLGLGGFTSLLGGSGGEDLELGVRARGTGIRIVFDPEWVALNYDRPFTFSRLVDRQMNYRRQRQALFSHGLPVQDWMALGPPRLHHRALAFLGTDSVIRLLSYIGGKESSPPIDAACRFLFRASMSARTRTRSSMPTESKPGALS
jgi:glycosyltransferase involved in cell wall biosynthesis